MPRSAAAAIAVLLILALGPGSAPAGAAGEPKPDLFTPVDPQHSERYPLFTRFTGPCQPEERLSGSGYVSRTHTFSMFFLLEGTQERQYQTIRPTGRPGNNAEGQQYAGFCKAGDQTRDGVGTTGNGVPGFVARNPGTFSMRVFQWSLTYFYNETESPPRWSSDNDRCCPPPQRIRSPQFEVYNACVWEIASVRGNVIVRIPGRGGITLNPRNAGGSLPEGTQVNVNVGGELVMRNRSGNLVTIGPGVSRLASRDRCELRALPGAAFLPPQPSDPPPFEMDEGTITQRARKEIADFRNRAKDVFVDDCLMCNLGQNPVQPRALARGSAAGDAIVVRVTRSKRAKTTTACALKGRVRIQTTNRRVARTKRALIVPQGRCGQATDGQAPRLLPKGRTR